MGATMFGRLPRLHRCVLFTLSALAGAGLGAWVSHWSLGGADQACSDAMLGVCVAPGVNAVPLVAGAALGLMIAVWLVSEPHEPRRIPVERDRRR
jgi:hypothetical protein